jgi:hypothetical protein
MRRNGISVKLEDRMNNNILSVKGVLELIFAGITGDFESIDAESVQVLINDAQKKLDEIREVFIFKNSSAQEGTA